MMQIETESTNTSFSKEALTKARDFIQGSEGLRLEAYLDTGGVWTIGLGHTKGVKKGDKITKEQAQALFEKDFTEHAQALRFVKIPLFDNEKIALVSFIYNVGAAVFKNSTLLKKLNAGDKKGAASEFGRWIYDNGKVLRGLVLRRDREKNLFLGLNCP